MAEHTELCWLLCGVTELGRLQRMHQFRDKSAAQRDRELVSAGLLVYPVLQAADVLAYRAQEVPVGEDQREHLELMRDVARRFNARFADGRELLVVPEHRIPEVGARIMDLQDPTTKMSTTGGSEQGTVYVLDEPQAIEKKIKSAVTDSGSEIVRAPDKPGVSNLIEILAAASAQTPEQAQAQLADARGYGDLKAAVAAAVIDYLAPVRERYGALRADEPALERVLEDGAARARVIASRTLADVRERDGRRRAPRERLDGPPCRPSQQVRCAHDSRDARPRPGRVQRAVRPAADADPARRGGPARGVAGRRRARPTSTTCRGAASSTWRRRPSSSC